MANKSPIFIILNGASETGKSTAVARGLMYRLKQFPEVRTVQDSFANPMKHFIAVTLGVKYADLKKNSPMDILQGYSPREFLIDLSEHYMKERYGEDFYGRSLVYRVLRLDPIPDIVVVEDGGFDCEKDAVGFMARVVRVTRPGKTFQGDSRKHIDDPHYTLDNDGTLTDLEPKLDDLSDWVLNELSIARGRNVLEPKQ